MVEYHDLPGHGIHMASRSMVIGLSLFVYAASQCDARDLSPACSSWTIEALAGVTSALLVVALLGPAPEPAWGEWQHQPPM